MHALGPLWARSAAAAGAPPAAGDGKRGGEVPGAESTAVRLRRTMQAFGRARERAGAPSPAWVVAPPLVQIPVLVTVALAVRELAASGGHGLGHGGALWFGDLTLPALDLVALTAPMGVAGCALPFASAGLFFANTQLALGRSDPRTGGWALLWRTALEWVSVGVLAVGLQLPQGALCWWVGSGLFTTAQTLALRQPAVRHALALPGGDGAATRLPGGREAGRAALRGGVGAPEAEAGKRLDPRMRSWTVAAREAGQDRATAGPAPPAGSAQRALQEAAELKAQGDTRGAAGRLQAALKRHPDDFALHFVLGRLGAERKLWEKAAKHYGRAAGIAREAGHAPERANALFGEGVALAKVGREGEALGALRGAGSLSPGHLGAWMALASLLRRRGDPEGALQALRKAAAIDTSVEERFIRPLEAEMREGPIGGGGQKPGAD